jgi:serine/threonine-protein kinase
MAGDGLDLASPLDLPTGACVGEYIVIRKLGEGGMGSVYGARHSLLDREAAIKVMREHTEDPKAVQQFIQEARAVNAIGHPNIVDIFAFGTLPDGRPYFVMEWLRGESLATRLRHRGISIKEACTILMQLCDALLAAHVKGIVHRDLKPDNVFLVPTAPGQFRVKLLDFGIAKTRGRAKSGHQFVGTPAYVAPEQARGRYTDCRADIYSLGVLAFEMIVGKPPFSAKTPMDVIALQIDAVPPLVSSLKPGTPAMIVSLIARMLAKRPSDRPPLSEISRACAAFAIQRETGPHTLTNLPLPRRRAETIETVAKRSPRLPLRALLLLLGACLAGPIGYTLGESTPPPIVTHRRAEPPPELPAPAPVEAKVDHAAGRERTTRQSPGARRRRRNELHPSRS